MAVHLYIGYIAAKLRKSGAIIFIRSNVPQSLMKI